MKRAEDLEKQSPDAIEKYHALKSSLTSFHLSMLLQEAREFSQIRDKLQQMETSPSLPGYGSGVSALNGTRLGSIDFPSSEASSSSSVPQPGLLGTQANFHQSLYGNTRNPLFTCGSSGSSDMEASPLSCGGLAAGLMKQMDSQKLQSRPNPYANDNTYANNAGIRLNDDDGELIPAGQTSLINGNGLNGGYGLISGTSGIMANAAFGHLTPGASSSSARFDNATYQIPPAFAGANEQENTSMLSPLSSQQQYGPGNNAQNDFTNFAPINNASVNGNKAQAERFGEGIEDSLFDFHIVPSNHQLFFQQEGGECAVNPNLGSGSGSHQAGLNLPINQSQNPGIYEAFAAGHHSLSPWFEPTLEQLREIEKVLDPELSSNVDTLNGYYPSFDQNANQRGSQDSINKSKLNGLYPQENYPSGDQGWDDEFIISLFHENPN